jgi:copper homeostasis protein
MSKVLLEIAAFNIEAALNALAAGADRIEFCENPMEGGTTPSYGSLLLLSQLTKQPVFPIIRPRGGDFLYTDREFQVMQNDLMACQQLGFKGAVIGLLNADGSIDTKRTSALIQAAGNMEISFHRAFDRCQDPFLALEQLIDIGCKRILTSGQVPNVVNAIPMIQQLVEKANDRIIILPGSGVRADNIATIVAQTGAKEMHSSARKAMPSKMIFNQLTMQENMQYFDVDPDEIKAMLTAINIAS